MVGQSANRLCDQMRKERSGLTFILKLTAHVHVHFLEQPRRNNVTQPFNMLSRPCKRTQHS